MCFFDPLRREGKFLYSPAGRIVLASKSKRKRAMSLPCGKRPSLCWVCGPGAGIVSPELAVCLQDPHFTLPAHLTREQPCDGRRTHRPRRRRSLGRHRHVHRHPTLEHTPALANPPAPADPQTNTPSGTPRVPSATPEHQPTRRSADTSTGHYAANRRDVNDQHADVWARCIARGIRGWSASSRSYRPRPVETESRTVRVCFPRSKSFLQLRRPVANQRERR